MALKNFWLLRIFLSLQANKNVRKQHMKVININSGLGNQMLAYCVVLSIRKENPSDTCYVETIIYDILECNEVISHNNITRNRDKHYLSLLII